MNHHHVWRQWDQQRWVLGSLWPAITCRVCGKTLPVLPKLWEKTPPR